MFPATIGQFVGRGSWLGHFANMISPGTFYMVDLYDVDYLLHLLLDSDAISSRADRFRYEKKWGFYSGNPTGQTDSRLSRGHHGSHYICRSVVFSMIAVLPTLVGKLLASIRRLPIFLEAPPSDFGGRRARYLKAD